MKCYLLDTNVFFDVLEAISKGILEEKYGTIINEQCYISELTRIEIISVLGKHARGCKEQWQPCNRIVSRTGGLCSAHFLTPGKKRWKLLAAVKADGTIPHEKPEVA